MNDSVNDSAGSRRSRAAAWFRALAGRPDRLAAAYVGLLLAAAGYYFATWPIVAGDQDLWYHLAAGRYILEHGKIPASSFFSFITPERHYVDYYWLFQVVAYGVFRVEGYGGLIALRTLLYLLTATAVTTVYLKGRREPYSVVYAVLLAIFTLLVIVPRELAIRPHLFSYLLIALFILLLEFQPRRLTLALPLLALGWVNLHGVEYPVMLLILGAHLSEDLYQRRKGDEVVLRMSHAVAIGLSALAVLATPFGVRLLPVPFTPTGEVGIFIHELKSLSWRDFMSVFGLVFVLGWLSLGVGLWRRRIRVAHLLLFAGGVTLLLKGMRFVNEFVLLATPLLATSLPVSAGHPARAPVRWLAGSAVAIFALVPFLFLYQFFWNVPHYPLSDRDLPLGTSSFLSSEGARGTVLNHPNHGGYLQWALYPRQRIYMDLQLPFLFTYDDFRKVHDAFVNPTALGAMLDRYRPAFIVAPIETSVFGRLIREHADYRPVSFDDWTVLFVDRRQEPGMALRSELTAVDPYDLTDEALRAVPPEKRQRFEAELARIADLPGTGAAASALAMLYVEEGRFAEALPLAERVVVSYPESFTGYKLKGDALRGMNRSAAAACRAALKRAPCGMKPLIERDLRALEGEGARGGGR